MTVVERDTRRILSHAVVYERTWDTLQTLVDTAPPGQAYFSDGFATYGQLMYPAAHTVALGKSQTYSVEGDNAELRHYLACLARKSRCFSRCLWALARAVDLFVYAWNKRQLFRRQYPRLPAHVRDFITDLI